MGEYEAQAKDLFQAWSAGDSAAVEIFKTKHPRFLDERIPWLPKKLSDSEVRSTPLNLADAQLALARWYDFRDWSALATYVAAVTQKDSPMAIFEWAVEAVINGDVAALQSALHEHAELVRARSARVMCFDPPVHRATLLHYLAANGVEGYRQKTPANAVDVAKMLLEAGAEVDALADMYGGRCTTMSMLVSSTPPATAGVQVPLIHTLVDFGAAVEDRGTGQWTSPLMTALVFGFRDAAEALVRRGARVDSLPAAAGLGRYTDAARLLETATPDDRHRALALAAQHGHVDIVQLLLDRGENPDRYNPKGHHTHSTPLHQAVWSGHDDVVRLLVERGASLNIRDTIYQGTPLDWAEYGGRTQIAAYLRAHAA